MCSGASEWAGLPPSISGTARPDSPAHSLAPELTLRPVLTEIGGTVPGRGLYVVDADHADPAAYADWLAATRPVVTRYLRGPAA